VAVAPLLGQQGDEDRLHVLLAGARAQLRGVPLASTRPASIATRVSKRSASSM
jgi:hypothetical protein